MQAIAKEMNFSETTFVLPPETPDTDFRVRIFTPGDELPMAGHPTIGTTFALARSGRPRPGRDRLVFGLGIGPTPVSLTWRGGELTLRVDDADRADLRRADRRSSRRGGGAVDLPPAAVAGTGLPVQIVSCGVPFLFVPLATRRAVDNAALNATAYDAFCRAAGVDGVPVFLFSTEPADDKATVYSRMFAPGFGITEDPATGSASGPLGCYLVRHKVVPPERAGSDAEPAGREDGPAEPRAHLDRRRGRRDRQRAGRRRIGAGRRRHALRLTLQV